MADASTLTDTFSEEQFTRLSAVKLLVVCGLLASIAVIATIRGDYSIALLSATVALDYGLDLPSVIAVAGYLTAGVLFFVTTPIALVGGALVAALLVAALLETDVIERIQNRRS